MNSSLLLIGRIRTFVGAIGTGKDSRARCWSSCRVEKECSSRQYKIRPIPNEGSITLGINSLTRIIRLLKREKERGWKEMSVKPRSTSLKRISKREVKRSKEIDAGCSTRMTQTQSITCRSFPKNPFQIHSAGEPLERSSERGSKEMCR